jgi:predicted Zn finger-like uncharacterized protein
MILTCPQCSTRYHVDPAALGTSPRTVRCANCGQSWSAKPPADTPTIVEFGAASPSALRPDPATAPEQAPRRRSPALIGWLIAGLIALLVASAVIGRNEIVSGFPVTASIYQQLGLPTAIDLGLQFEGIKSTRQEEGGISVLVVEGAIVNVADSGRSVPPIRITLLDKSGRELQEELFKAKEQRLEPGSKTSFSGRVVNPADQARDFRITFEMDP